MEDIILQKEEDIGNTPEADLPPEGKNIEEDLDQDQGQDLLEDQEEIIIPGPEVIVGTEIKKKDIIGKGKEKVLLLVDLQEANQDLFLSQNQGIIGRKAQKKIEEALVEIKIMKIILLMKVNKNF